MSTKTSQSEPTQVAKAVRPYPASWVDRLNQLVTRLPGPTWLAYLSMLLLALVVNHIVRWLDGSLPAGRVDILRIAEALYVVLVPAVQHYLNITARTALDGFRPVMQVSDQEFDSLQYRLTTVPGLSGALLGLFGAVLGLLSLFVNPMGFGYTPGGSLVSVAFSGFFAVLTTAFISVFIYHTLRQLSLVASVQRMAHKVNIFQLAPLHSFSTFTSRTGIAIIFMLSFGYVFVYFSQAPGALVTFYVLIMVLMLIVALACFALPLNSMHDRLSQEKTAALAEVNRRLEHTIGLVHERLDRGEFQTMEQMEKALANLITERKVLSEVSTWPWRPETLRGLISSFALPVILYIITTLLGRALGF